MKKRITAFLLMLTLLAGCTKAPESKKVKYPEPVTDIPANATVLAKAVYPATVPYPNETDYADDWDKFDDDYNKWWQNEKAVRELETSDTGIREYVIALVGQLLKDNGNNAVISPANIYFALAMLAQVTDGDSQKQVLDLLGYDDIDALNTNTKNLWQKLYKNDGLTTSVLANSLWMSDEYSYNTDTVNELSGDYFASSFSGDFTDPAYSQALRDWLNEQTGGLLEEQTKGVGFSDETVFAIASTIYYKAQWTDKFHKLNTEPGTFHGTDGDVTADFMHSGFSRPYYYSDKFSATAADLEGGGRMYLILPDEGVSVEDVIAQSDCIDLITGSKQVNSKNITVNLALPKFDVSYDKNIASDLQALGVTAAFDDAKSDFSPLISGIPMELTTVNHTARVTIDEEGCEAAAYTVMTVDGTAMPPNDEVDMTFDRPFIFAITGEDSLPRFIGIINNI